MKTITYEIAALFSLGFILLAIALYSLALYLELKKDVFNNE